MFGRETDDATGALNQAGGFERWKAIFHRHTVVGLQAAEVNACELTKPEEEFLFERVVGRDCFQLFDRGASGGDRLNVGGGVVRVGPSLCAREGVRACAEAEIRLASPIFEIVR